jgi:hypothetical protein
MGKQADLWEHPMNDRSIAVAFQRFVITGPSLSCVTARHQPNVTEMVTAMPCIQGSNLIQPEDSSMFGMDVFAVPIMRAHVAEHHLKPWMDLFQHPKGRLHRQAVIWKLRPAILRVGLDGRLVLGERELESNEAVQVAVGHMMHDLPDCPPFRPVRLVEYEVLKVLDLGTQHGRERGECPLELLELRFRNGFRLLPAAHREAQGFEF